MVGIGISLDLTKEKLLVVYTIHISKKVSLVSGKANNLGSLSHKLFHAYQDDKGRMPHTIYNELEAYVFSGVI